MTDDQIESRAKLHFMILNQVSGIFLATVKKPLVPLLGSDYEYRFEKLWDRLIRVRKEILQELIARDREDLTSSFHENGVPQTPEAKQWLLDRKAKVSAEFGRLQDWYAFPLDPKRGGPKYDYWSMAEFFRLDEVLWLSTGLEPSPDLTETVFARETTNAHERVIHDHVKSRRLLLMRALDPNHQNARLKPDAILDWVQSTGFPVQVGFIEMLKAAASRRTEAKPSEEIAPRTPDSSSGKVDARELVSLQKLLTAIAINDYGYDPSARRSPIPKELEDVAAQLGLELTAETIRKHLQIGARHLPSGWKPDTD